MDFLRKESTVKEENSCQSKSLYEAAKNPVILYLGMCGKECKSLILANSHILVLILLG